MAELSSSSRGGLHRPNASCTVLANPILVRGDYLFSTVELNLTFALTLFLSRLPSEAEERTEG